MGVDTITTDELLARIDRIRDELAEARRYVRQSWRLEPYDSLTALLLLPVHFRELPMLHRLAANIQAGQRAVTVSPSVLEGYLDGANYELSALRGRIEREGSEGR